MNQFEFYFKLGLNHVLDVKAYDHLLFLIVLTLPYLFKDWRRVLLLVSLFTLGHTLSLVFATYGIFSPPPKYIEFLIPVTILLTALGNIWRQGKDSNSAQFRWALSVTVFFGLIHGFGFSAFFRQVLASDSDKLLPMLEFALGIELAQLIIVLATLFASVVFYWIGVARRDLVIVLSSIIVGITLTLIKTAYPF